MRKYDDWIEAYMEYTERSEPPELYRKWVGISVAAAVLQRKCYLEWGPALTFYPNMYIVLVGPSGKCRKGTAMGVGKDLLDEVGVDMAAEAITREALIRELANTTDQVMREEGEMLMHSSLTIYSQELTVFLGYNNQKMLMDLTDWYDCRDNWTYRTKNMGTDEITGVWVNLIGATTPRLIRSSLPVDAVGGGLASRMIFVYEEDKGQSIPAPFGVDGYEDMRKDLIYDLEQMYSMNGQFKVTDSFLEEYVPWYKYQDKNEAIAKPEFMGYNQRRPNHLLKLCIILSATRREDRVITDEHFNDALTLLKRTEKKMPRTFSGHGESDESDVMARIMAYIARSEKTSKSELMTRFHSDIGSQQKLDEVIESLKVMGFVDVGEKPGTNERTLYYQEDHEFSEMF